MVLRSLRCQPHAPLVAALMYECRGGLANRFLREALGGWQISTITTFEIGRADHGLERLHESRLHGDFSHGPATAIYAWCPHLTHYSIRCFVNPPPDPLTGIATHRGNRKAKQLGRTGSHQLDISLARPSSRLGGRELQRRARVFPCLQSYSMVAHQYVDDRQVNSGKPVWVHHGVLIPAATCKLAFEVCLLVKPWPA